LFSAASPGTNSAGPHRTRDFAPAWTFGEADAIPLPAITDTTVAADTSSATARRRRARIIPLSTASLALPLTALGDRQQSA
jgi:hypothetical protein